jgi:hypothetical protein
MKPALKLRTSVEANRQTAICQPSVPTLRKKISGSIEGEATQKAITGARGTPPISSAATMGITPQEQKGLKAPTAVANTMATTGRARKAPSMYLEAPDIRTATAMGMVTSK